MAFFVFQTVFTLPVQAGGLLAQAAPTPEAGSGVDYGWLSFPTNASALASDRSLVLLAGKLILNGLVDASGCPNNGLLKNGAANPCGEIAARPAVIVWQNQFDRAILDASNRSGVPPFLLKNVLAQETQFWPTSRPTVYGYSEMGLGHVTEMGADTLLRWNPAYEAGICPAVFGPDTCKKPFVFMPVDQQAALRGMVMQQLNTDCSNCRGGLSLQVARRSINTIAEVLRANYTHAKWLTDNLGKSSPGQNMLWRFALAGYNAGPGCLTNALARARALSSNATWKEVAAQFDPACHSTVDYIETVTHVQTADPTALANAAKDESRASALVYYYLQIDYPGQFVTPTNSPTAVSTATSMPSQTPQSTALIQPTQSETLVSGTPESTSTAIPATMTLTVLPTLSATPVASDVFATSTPDNIAATPSETPSLASTGTIAASTATLTAVPPSETPVVPTSEPATATPTAIPEIPTSEPQTNSQTRLLVKFGSLVPALISDLIIKNAGARIESEISQLGLTIISVSARQAPQLLQDLQNNLMVAYAEPDSVMQAFYAPNDPDFVSQTYYADMQIPQAWDVTHGENSLVAIIDTGVDMTHPELSASLWVNPGETGTDANGKDKRSNGVDDDGDGYVDNGQGWNFLTSSSDVSDLHGHGTHAAGLIAARMDNSQGIAGIAPASSLMVLKALDDTGKGSSAQVAEAIVYAVDHGAKIINLGLGGEQNSAALLAATDYAYAHNVTVIAAAGNRSSSISLYPAANPHVIAVAGLDLNFDQASFASYGSYVELAAPGVGIQSTMPGGVYGLMSGSSMSAAQVTGIAALLASQPQFDSPDKIRAALVNTARDLGQAGRDDNFGYGLPRAYDALSYTSTGLVTPTPRITALPPTETATPDAGLIPDTIYIMAADAANANLANYSLTCSAAAYTTELNGTNIAAIQADNAVSGALNIGFDFWYMGTRYTQVYASSNGWISLSSPGANNYAINSLDTTGGTARPIIAPLWDDLNGTGGTARYTTSGTTPNRIFTIEWWNWTWSNTTPNINFRVVLFENTGVVRFMYGLPALSTDPATGSASIGLTGFNSGVYRSMQSIPAAAATCPTLTTPELASLATRPVSGQQWNFTPLPVPAAVTALNVNTITGTTLNLTWQDNATNETGYAVYDSPDGVNWNFVAGAAVDATAYAVSGLAAGSNLYWRVQAVNEGAQSSAPVLNAPGGLSISNLQNTSLTLNWTDNSSNETGFLIYNSTDGLTYNLVTQTAANIVTYNASGLTPGTTYTWRVMAISPSIISAAAQVISTFSSQLPVVSIITPLNGSTVNQNTIIMLMGSAIVPTNGNISGSLQWTSSLDGTIGSGASFATSSLSPGMHTITASVTDVYGRTAQASITLTVLSFDNPHYNFTSTTDKCAICHLPHTGQSGSLLNSNQSPLASNTFCMSCHSTGSDGAPTVSTHSNIDWPGNSVSRVEPAQFELLCVQCHDPHGGTNLSAIRVPDNPGISTDDAYSGVRITISPLLKADVTFTSTTGANSFDEIDGPAPLDGGAAANSDDLCVTCHSNSSNPGYPMALHNGGIHFSGADYRGLNCINCHPHSLDANASTRDGFMTGCRACHSQPQDNGDNVPPGGRRQIVGASGGDFTRSSHHITGSDAVTDADCQVCHEMTQHKSGSVRLFNVDTPATVYTLSPVINSTDDPADFENFCTSCHDANGRAGNTTPFSDKKVVPSISSLWASARHNLLVGSFKGTCIDCHDSGHGSNKLKLLAPWNMTAQTAPDAMLQEERFCFGCHGAAGPGRPIETSFSYPITTNTATSIYEHNVSVDTGLNHGKEIFGSSFAAGPSRHVECGDCHEAHIDAYPNTATAPAIKLSQRGATGVDPIWPATGGAPTGFNFLSQAVNEYQVCFKCHSSYTNLPTYAPTGLAKLTSTSQLSESRDLASEFNPATGNATASFHPVAAAGRNTTVLANTFVAPWTPTSRVYCSDCHTNAAATGPHGSPNLHILAGTAAYITADNNNTNAIHNTGELCFKCHQYATYVDGANDRNYGLHQTHEFAACYDCHDSHGSANQRLVNFNTAHVTFTGGRNSLTAINFTTKSCTLSCHGQNHNNFTYP